MSPPSTATAVRGTRWEVQRRRNWCFVHWCGSTAGLGGDTDRAREPNLLYWGILQNKASIVSNEMWPAWIEHWSTQDQMTIGLLGGWEGVRRKVRGTVENGMGKLCMPYLEAQATATQSYSYPPECHHPMLPITNGQTATVWTTWPPGNTYVTFKKSKSTLTSIWFQEQDMFKW